VPTTTAKPKLQNDLAVFNALICKDVETAQDLASNLGGVYRALQTLDIRRYDLGDHRSAAPELMNQVFNLQLSVNDKIKGWHARGLMSREVQTAARNVLRAARYAGDLLGELWISHDRLAPDRKTLRGFTGNDHNTFVSPKHATGGNVPFKSGDVILTRGRRHNSAAIARIGDIDSQFSHIAMVYIDADGQHWVVESVIEEGARIVPLTYHLDDSLARAIIFRHRDTNLAQRAAFVIHDRVRHSLSRRGKRILYDFTMELDNKHNLFCSKVVRRAFKEASEHRVLLPTFPTQLNMKNFDFPNRIGVTAKTTFGPGDMELEPDFDVVAEWQDYRVTADLRLQDMTMDKLFEWMDNDNFRFKETFLIRLIAFFGRASTYMSTTIQDLIDDVIPKVPPNMSRRAIATIAMLHNTGQELLETLRKHDEDAILATGLPMHPSEIKQKLDEIHAASPNEQGYLKRAR